MGLFELTQNPAERDPEPPRYTPHQTPAPWMSWEGTQDTCSLGSLSPAPSTRTTGPLGDEAAQEPPQGPLCMLSPTEDKGVLQQNPSPASQQVASLGARGPRPPVRGPTLSRRGCLQEATSHFSHDRGPGRGQQVRPSVRGQQRTTTHAPLGLSFGHTSHTCEIYDRHRYYFQIQEEAEPSARRR